MKRLCVILLLVLLLPGLLLGAGAALPEYYGESYYAELPAMVEIPAAGSMAASASRLMFSVVRASNIDTLLPIYGRELHCHVQGAPLKAGV